MNSSAWPLMLTGFAVLCLVSSISYTINDIVDRKEDRAHPEKRKRPIASGRISICEACALIIVLSITALYLSMLVPIIFSMFAAALFLSTLLYTFYLKNLALVDIHIVAVNFILRTVSGAVILNITISPWLIMVVFLLALFLAIGKRKSEIEKFGHENLKKVVFKFYTRDLLNRLTDITATMLLMSYILYTSFTHDFKLMFTIPLATFLVFRYLYFIQSNSEVARKSELVFRDKQMLTGIVIWIVLSILLLYL
jgi:4-hydroxybenzoate polyprenyltransferase